MNYKIFDAHCDTLNELLTKDETLEKNTGMISTKMMKGYNGYIQVFAAWINRKIPNPLLQAIERADKFYEETKRSGITAIKDKKTLKDVVESSRLGAILAIEDGAALCGSIRVLNMLYSLGFRLITLTWNGMNELGSGAVGGNGGGLSEFGREVIKKMNELGMVIDVSHISEKAFWDTLELSQKPVIASHSNAKAVCDHKRNLSDEQIKALINSGGAMGINLYTDFLNDTKNSKIKDVLNHIEHVLSLGGENALGIGTDFDGISAAAEGLENAEKLYKLFDEMKKIGYSDELIEKITYKNFTRIFMECL